MISNEKGKNKKENQKSEEEIKNEQSGEKIPEETDEYNLKIETLEKELNDYKDKLLRKAAEFENYKRRSENDQINLIKYSAESFIIKILPVIDDLERSLQHIDGAKDVESIKDGLNLVYDKLMKILDDQGVKKIDSIGKPFNVDFHEALLQKKDDSVEPHTVIDEIEKGYMYKDRVIRHAKVIVSEDSAEESIELNNNKIDNDEENSEK